jgi:uncharacterized membrane protein
LEKSYLSKNSFNANDDKIAWFIFFVALIYRLFDAGNFSISADELSALSRINYDSFYDLIYKGVVPDMHPPLVQIFIFYWCKIFGTGEWMLRLPFVLLGSFSVYLSYSAAKKFIGSSPALFVMAIIATSQLFFIYSRIARPYAFGLFFCLSTVYFWQNIFVEKSTSIFQFLLLGLSMGLAMLTHAMSFLFVGMVGITGLFLLRKEIAVFYLLSGVLAVVCFLPFINVFLFQLSQGGVGGDNGWLAKPDIDFFEDFFKYIFNHSRYYLYTILLFGVLLIVFAKRNFAPIKWKFISLMWFLTPMLFAYFYSIKVNPILQNSVLIFSTPFLFIFLFSFFGEIEHKKIKYIFVWSFLASLLFISIYIQKIYSKQFFGVYKEIVELSNKWNTILGSANIKHKTNVDSKFFIDYYNNRLKEKINYGESYVLNLEKLKYFEKEVENASKTKLYFSYSWSNLDNMFEAIPIIKKHYPYLMEKKYFNNSEFYIFSKNKNKYTISDSSQRVFNCDFDAPTSPFTGTNTPWQSDSSMQLLSASNNYSINYKNLIEGSFYDKNSMLNLSVDLNKLSDNSNAILVFECKRNDSLIDWKGLNFNLFESKKGEWYNLNFVCKWNKNYKIGDVISSYIWNNGNDSLLVKNFRIESREANPLVYGKYNNW